MFAVVSSSLAAFLFVDPQLEQRHTAHNQEVMSSILPIKINLRSLNGIRNRSEPKLTTLETPASMLLPSVLSCLQIETSDIQNTIWV